MTAFKKILDEIRDTSAREDIVDNDWPPAPYRNFIGFDSILFERPSMDDINRSNRIWKGIYDRVIAGEQIGYSRFMGPVVMSPNEDGTPKFTPWDESAVKPTRTIVVGSDPGMSNVKKNKDGEIVSFSLFEMSLTPPYHRFDEPVQLTEEDKAMIDKASRRSDDYFDALIRTKFLEPQEKKDELDTDDTAK